SKYDVIENRTIEDVNKIGARLKHSTILECKKALEDAGKLALFQYNLDGFLGLKEKSREELIKELNNNIIKNLLKIKGISFSTSTKILHTIYPEIIPMIDNPLQQKYKEFINPTWDKTQGVQILIDFYNNLLIESNRKNLDIISDHCKRINLTGLRKIRIFDIIWWSYLKAERLKESRRIKWTSIS
ncbi:MAG: hypothetical protein WAW45_03670, partial [Atribacterota bacterium]